MRVAILGANGMVGHILYENLHVQQPFEKTPFTRVNLDATNPDFSAIFGFDYVINCIGIVKQRIDLSHSSEYRDETTKVNTLFPWRLSRYCSQNNIKLIHVSTDCVFSGKTGYYKESDVLDFDLDDHYSTTKAFGEPENCMVIRTSFVGPEKSNFLGLMEWTKKQSGSINGFTNHLWNGITTNQFAKSIQKIIEDNLYENGICHIFSSKPVTKYDMIKCFNDHFGLGLTIVPTEHEQEIIRTLSTEKGLNEKLAIPSFQEMVKEI